MALMKPALLFYIATRLGVSSGNLFAAIMLTSLLVLVSLGVDIHRNYYNSYFGGSPRTDLKKTLTDYLAALIIILGLGAVFIFGVLLYQNQNTELIVAAMFFLLSEKLCDEMMRYCLFSENFDRWGFCGAFRFLLSIFLAILIVEFFDSNSVAHIVGSMAFGNFCGILYLKLSGTIDIKFGKLKVRSSLYSGLKLIYKSSAVWVLSLLGAAYTYLDRIITINLDATSIGYFTLVVSAAAVLQMMIDYFYTSLVRKRLLDGTIGINSVVTDIRWQVSVLLGLGIAAAAMLFVHLTETLDSELSLGVYICVIGYQFLVANTQIVKEINFWRKSINLSVLIELFGLSLFGIAIFSINQIMKLDLLSTLIIGLICLLFRFIFHCLLSITSSEFGSRQPS